MEDRAGYASSPRSEELIADREQLGLMLAALSVLLLPVMEVEAVEGDGPHYAERIFGGFATALRTSAWAPALVALGFTTAFWHYWLDRAVYRFSDPRVRLAARGLLAARPS